MHGAVLPHLEDVGRGDHRPARTSSSSRSASTRATGFEISPGGGHRLPDDPRLTRCTTRSSCSTRSARTRPKTGRRLDPHLRRVGEPRGEPDAGALDQHRRRRGAAGRGDPVHRRRSCSARTRCATSRSRCSSASIVGTYSTLFVAAPLYSLFRESEPDDHGARQARRCALRAEERRRARHGLSAPANHRGTVDRARRIRASRAGGERDDRDAGADHRASLRRLVPRIFSRAQPTGAVDTPAQDGADAPPEGRPRAHRARVRGRREGARRAEAQERRAVHHASGRGRADPRRPRHRAEDDRRRAAARHRRRHRLHPRPAARRLRRRDRDARRRRHQARQGQVRRQRAGRDRPQDDRRDVEGHPRADHQARRPAAQRPHLGLRAGGVGAAQGARDARDLRAARAPARHPDDQVGARRPLVRGAVSRSSTPRSRASSSNARRSARSSCSRSSTPSTTT